MADDKVNLDKDAKEKMQKTRQLNIKNIGKAAIIGFGVLFLIILFFNFFESNKTKKNEQNAEESFSQRNVGSELDNEDYSNSRIQAIDEKIKETETEEYNPDYDIPATEEADPIADFIKAQELEKVKRLYEARSSGFNNNDYLKYITAGIEETSSTNMQKEKIQFMKNAAVSNFTLQEMLLPSVTKYEVKAGTYIPVVITVGIDSDLPGNFQAMVREDIYDTNTGTELLIPMGSKVFGQFSSEVSWGQTRIQVVFNRLTLPNGKSINLETMGIADSDGKSGLEANVDLRLGKVFGSVIMAAVIGGGQGALTNNGKYEKDRNAALSGAGEAGGEQSIEIVDKYVSKLIDVQPKLTKEFGGRANIVVNKDIILEKYNKEIKYLVD